MVKPLRYSLASRQERYELLKLLVKNKDITKQEYSKRITKLNKIENTYRDKQEEKKFIAIQKKIFEKEQEKERKEAERIAREARREIEKMLVRIKLIQGAVITRAGLTSHRYNIIGLPGITPNSNEIIDRLVAECLRALTSFNIQGHKVLIRLHIRLTDGWYWTPCGTLMTPITTTEFTDFLREKIVHFANGLQYSDAELDIDGIEFVDIPRPQFGGCDSNTHHKKLGEIKIMSPKSTKNNCLFACIHHHLKSRILCDDTRKKLKIAPNTPIHIDNIEPIAKFYNIRIKLYDMEGVFVKEYNSDAEDECRIMLYVNNNGAGHYVLIEGEVKKCDECSKSYIHKHTCNTTVRRQMWLNRMSGKRNVIPSKVVRDAPFDNNKMLYFDLETFKPNDTDAIEPYASAWYCDGKYYQSYGENSWNDFVEFVLEQKDKILCAYNGAGFDFHFLMAELISRSLDVRDVILNNGRLMAFKFGDNIRCWDLCLFTLSSLKSSCKDFKVSDDNAKTEFDHFKIKSWEDVELYRGEVEPYIKRDVMGMKEVFEKFSEMVYKIFKCHMTEFVTLSAMSYAIWTTSTTKLIEIPDTEKYNFIRQSLYGGRTYPLIREFVSKDYKDIIENVENKEYLQDKYKSMNDWIFNADATSLYPTAMVKYKYPVGNSKWADVEKIDASNLPIGIYDVDVECNQDLTVPILPNKTPTGGISWNLLPRRGVYTSADLENGLQHGYKITKIHKALTYDKSEYIFEEYIMKCYKIKEENDDNPVLRQVGKILMNALYGKMLEKARFEESSMCNNIGDVWKFETVFDTTDVQFIKDKVMMIGLPKDEKISDERIKKPSQVGTFILSYSRRHMMNAMMAINPKLDDHFFTYTDTDSLHIHCSKLPGLEEKGWLSKGLGQLSDDAKGGRIFREINLAPKLYMYLCLMPNGDIKTTMKSKGIPNQYLSPELFVNAETMVNEDKVIVMKNRLKKVGLGRHLQTDWRKYDAFSILSVDMERTFYKNMWFGMDYKDGKWFPKK